MLITSLTLSRPSCRSWAARSSGRPSPGRRSRRPAMYTRLGNAVGRRPLVDRGRLGPRPGRPRRSARSGSRPTTTSAPGSPQNTESAKALKDLRASLPPGLTDPTEVYVQSQTAPLDAQALEQFRQTLAARRRRRPGACRPSSTRTRPSPRSPCVLKLNPNSNEAIDLVKGPLRRPVHQNAPPGTKVLVGGTTAIFGDINKVNSRDLSVILPVAVRADRDHPGPAAARAGRPDLPGRGGAARLRRDARRDACSCSRASRARTG